MNHYHGTVSASAAPGEVCYLSPRGHYYVTQGVLDTRFARHAELMNRYHPHAAGKTPSQFELAKRAARA